MYQFDPTTGTLTVKGDVRNAVSFRIEAYPYCCQARVLCGFNDSEVYNYLRATKVPLGAVKSVSLPDWGTLLDTLDMGHCALFAITSSEQVLAAHMLKAMGFEESHEWSAVTGSYLTSWYYNPGNQEPESEDEDYEHEEEEF